MFDACISLFFFFLQVDEIVDEKKIGLSPLFDFKKENATRRIFTSSAVKFIRFFKKTKQNKTKRRKCLVCVCSFSVSASVRHITTVGRGRFWIESK